MDTLTHDFLNELTLLQERHGLYVSMEHGVSNLQLKRIPVSSYLTCSIMGHSEFEYFTTPFPVQENDLSNNNEQEKP